MRTPALVVCLLTLLLAAAGVFHALLASSFRIPGLVAAVLLLLAFGALAWLAGHQRERIHDIERALDRSRLRAQAVIDASPDGVVLIRDGRIHQANPAFRALLALPADEEIAGHTFLSLVAEEDRPAVEQWLRRRSEGAVEPAQLTFSGLRRSGARVELEASCALVPSRHGKQLALFLRDLGERRTLELRLRNVTRLEALADVAESLARAFEKVFREIRSLARDPREEIPDTQRLERIDRLATRGSALARRVLQLAPTGLEGPAPPALDTGRLVREVCADFVRTLPPSLSVELEVQTDEPAVVRGDASHLRQAFWHLLQNAAEAQQEGEIRVRLRRLDLDSAGAATRPGSEGRPYLMIEVRDTGCGMSEKVRARAFSPFFTTKGKRASGLGLTMVYGAARAHGGFVELDSNPGQGTIARLALPLSDATLPETRQAPDDATRWRGREMLLVVDDDPSAREECRRLLEPFGYLVETVATPREALNRLRHRPRVDLVLLDMVLPGWNGPDVLRRILGHWPGQRVLMLCPYPLPDQEEVALREGAVGIYLKPLTAEALARSVRQALDAPPPASMLTGPA